MSKREARKNERRACILEVARRSFFENGYAATTMSEIAAKLGGSKGTLWSYFPSKEDLFAAVLDEATTEFKQQLVEILELHEDTRSTLFRLCIQFVTRVSRIEAIRLHRLIHGEGGRFPELGRIFYERGPKSVKAMIADYLDQCIQEGSIRCVDTAVAANQLVALCMAGAHQKMLLNIVDAVPPEEIRTEAASAVDVFLRCYATGASGD
ncbi:TetR/AcrR family transcriptional regulator [Rhizorhapis suberifaciens]|uniref:AcrR family transcriptional regulator n=1 Tax=Rhizorhapis suberifaciens TaxID=13656 RepID=A0A840HSL7_9SPHN|nr:TetR/AcrR family transcriptional regulator [Rhizorhapis suberifaciens]MBB4640504.1 AcrR family transcriptional regulator [Rhizorhapis suberifaciens]